MIVFILSYLQNIRQQIARSLERMRELEEEVKMIPVLQVQLSVLQEEKRKMLLHLKTRGDAHAHAPARQQHSVKQNGKAYLGSGRRHARAQTECLFSSLQVWPTSTCSRLRSRSSRRPRVT